MKLCECGCGGPAPIAKQTERRDGLVRGQSKRFISYHQNKGQNNPRWSGGRIIRHGYIMIWKPMHQRSNKDGYVNESDLIAEQALGHSLPFKSVIHHHNKLRDDNRNENLVICHDKHYHEYLHQRMRAYADCGRASWLKCAYCKQYDEITNMSALRGRLGGYHKSCHSQYEWERRHRE